MHIGFIRYYYTCKRIGDNRYRSDAARWNEIISHHVAKDVGGQLIFGLYGRAIRLVFLPVLLLTSRVAVSLTGASRESETELRETKTMVEAHLTFPHLHFLKAALGFPQCVQRYNTTLFGFNFGFAQ